MIVVTGATGNAGSEVVRALTALGGRVRAFVRDPGQARHKLGENVELAAGDFADPLSVRATLEGADALLLSCADDPRRARRWPSGTGTARSSSTCGRAEPGGSSCGPAGTCRTCSPPRPGWRPRADSTRPQARRGSR